MSSKTQLQDHNELIQEAIDKVDNLAKTIVVTETEDGAVTVTGLVVSYSDGEATLSI